MIFKYLNPFYWLPEDKTIRCGVYIFSLRKPKNDPYIDACRIDDILTTEDGWGEHNLTIERLIRHFHDMINEIQKDFKVGSKDYILGEHYKRLYNIFIPLFFKSKRKV